MISNSKNSVFSIQYSVFSIQYSVFSIQYSVFSIQVNGRFKVNSIVDQLQAVKAGLCIGLLPYLLALVEVKRENLTPILDDYWQDLGGVYIVKPH